MSSELAIRCPVCRAQQTLSARCRRCRADLSLLEKAYGRLAFLRNELSEASAMNNTARVAFIMAELSWLAPRSRD